MTCVEAQKYYCHPCEFRHDFVAVIALFATIVIIVIVVVVVVVGVVVVNI